MNKRFICVLAAFLLLVSLPATGHARVAQGEWFEKAPKGNSTSAPVATTKEGARLAALGEAVFAEALDLLHGGLSEERQVYLHNFLVSKASGFVVSYTELGVETLAEGRRLSMDVEVNRDSLRHELKRLGVYATLAGTLAYSPKYGNVLPETWEALGRLHILYGLTPSTAAPLELQLEYAGKAWTVTLRSPDNAPFFARSATLEEAWYKVWGSYFDGMNVDKVLAGSVVLSIEGWFTPDGVEAFDAMLQEWTDVLDSVSLQDVSMESAGISGRWAVNILDANKLNARLTEYTSKRRLSFSLKDR